MLHKISEENLQSCVTLLSLECSMMHGGDWLRGDPLSGKGEEEYGYPMKGRRVREMSSAFCRWISARGVCMLHGGC